MKLRSLIGLVLIIILVFASAYTVIFGLDFGMYSFEPMRAINLGMDVWGGTTAVLRIKDPGEDSADEDESNAEEEVIPLSQEELDNAAHEVMGIMRARLDAKGYTGATIERGR